MNGTIAVLDFGSLVNELFASFYLFKQLNPTQVTGHHDLRHMLHLAVMPVRHGVNPILELMGNSKIAYFKKRNRN